MRRSRIALTLLTGILAAVAAFLFAPILEHARAISPDGHFEVVVRTQPVYQFIAVMPGSGSDKPARATLYKDGRSCGSAALPMASFASDLTWMLDVRPRRAEIKFGGSWNLDVCTVEQR